MRRVLLLFAVAACAGDIDAGGSGVDAGPDGDPLAVGEATEPGSLDEVHRKIVAPRCSGQPGLCHNGQFEPNLSTPSLFYEYAVGRPALERPDRLRVAPGDPDASFLVDKLRNRSVSTQMPLGAEPLVEAEIALIEAWIRGGALRRPGADAPPSLNNPPGPPEIGVFSAGGERLDEGGPFTVPAGSSLVLRHSVSDFETADDAIAAGLFVLQTGARELVLSPGSKDPGVAATTYDPDGPMGNGDRLDWRIDVTIGEEVDLIDEEGVVTRVASAGLVFFVSALYVDELDGGFAVFATSPATLEVE